MLIASADVCLNHHVIRIGSKEVPEAAFPLAGAPVVASESHIYVAARAQIGLVRVKLWNKVGPVRGSVLFDGSVSLADGCIAICDIANVSSFVQSFGSPGVHRVQVSVDDPGNASRVDVILDPGVNRVSFTSVEGYELPYVWTAGDSAIGRFDELALVLSSHDLPVSRLSGALKIVSIAYEEWEAAGREHLRDFAMRRVIEWLRWLRDDISEEMASEAGRDISMRLSDPSSFESAGDLGRLANEVIESLCRT